MLYEFRFGSYTYDTVPVEELPTTADVQRHMDKVCRDNRLPYVTVTVRCL